MRKFAQYVCVMAVIHIICMAACRVSSAQISVSDGVVSKNELPSPTISDDLVVLNVPHINQKPFYCVPTSCSMILRYLGKAISPGALKNSAENGKPKEERNTKFTYWKDIQSALKSKGFDWQIKAYPKTEKGFENGWKDIQSSLKNDLPVMIEIHLDEGHSFVVIGYDEPNQKAFIRDPLLAKSKIRVLTYQQLLENWHNHKYSETRSALFPTKSNAEDQQR